MDIRKAAKNNGRLWHWWKVTPRFNLDIYNGVEHVAFCGARARNDALDERTDHLHGCGRCDQRKRAADKPRARG
jgi:hypothetical protein